MPPSPDDDVISALGSYIPRPDATSLNPSSGGSFELLPGNGIASALATDDEQQHTIPKITSTAAI